MLDTLPTPADIPAPASYHWTPALQAEFLGHLAATGTVRGAALFVQMTARAAYDLRDRRKGLAFRLGWAAAILVARARLEDELLDRAFRGVEDVHERIPGEDGSWQVRRRRVSARASMAMLERLDRAVAERATTPEARLVRIIAADFAAYCDLFTTDAFAADAAAALAAWFADQRARPDPLAALLAPPVKACEVAQISALSAPAQTPEEAAAALSIWYEEDEEDWVTDFPPPEGFEGREEGEYGDEDYWRTLDDAERNVVATWEAEDIIPFRAIAEARRREYFGLNADNRE